VEKSQYKLCIEVLRRLHKKGVLKNIVLIGSWCLPFYKEYFKDVKYVPSLRTTDIDFLVPSPSKIKRKVDVFELLHDLGFIIDFKGSKGYMRLQHPELVIEFLVPEKGKGENKPHPLPRLGLNAQPLRFLNFLAKNTIKVKIENISLRLPHPAHFALHKLIVSQRRRSADKSTRDKEAAIRILKSLLDKKEGLFISNTLQSLPKKWQKEIVKGLESMGEQDIFKT